MKLEELVLQSHVRLGLKANAGAEDVGQGGALLGKSIDDGSARRGQGSLEHVAEDTQDAVELLVLGSDVAVSGRGLPLDAGHHLSDHDKVDDERRSQKGILANVE